MKRRQLLHGLSLVMPAACTGVSPSAMAVIDSPLEHSVEKYIKRQRQNGLVASNERTAWAVYDLTANKKLVSINENQPLQAASLIKMFVCQAFFFLAKHEGYQYGLKTQTIMQKMIQKSDNPSTNQLLRIVGGPKRCQQILKKYAPSTFQHIHIVEYIPENGRTYLNRASVNDYSRFLFALWHRKLPFASEMLRLMGLPNRDRLKSDAPQVPVSVQVYDKTGSTSRLCGDAGIMVATGRNGQKYPYIMVGVIEKSQRTENYPLWIKRRGDVIRGVSGVVYQHFRQIYSLV